MFVTDGVGVYELKLSIANLSDGTKIAYAKKYISNAPQTIQDSIKKAEAAWESQPTSTYESNYITEKERSQHFSSNPHSFRDELNSRKMLYEALETQDLSAHDKKILKEYKENYGRIEENYRIIRNLQNKSDAESKRRIQSLKQEIASLDEKLAGTLALKPMRELIDQTRKAAMDYEDAILATKMGDKRELEALRSKMSARLSAEIERRYREKGEIRERYNRNDYIGKLVQYTNEIKKTIEHPTKDTDNETIHDFAIAKNNEYTIYTVKHLDGSDW